MPYRNPEDGRSWKRRRYRQQREERIAAGCCSKCGRRPAEPERRLCADCGARRRAADRARFARAKAEGRLDGRKAERRRRAARAGARRRYEARQAAGLCTKCGLREPDEGRSRCEPCRGRRNATDRRQWASRLAAGLCGACGEPVPSGRAPMRALLGHAGQSALEERVRPQGLRPAAGQELLCRLQGALPGGRALPELRKAQLPALRRASRASSRTAPRSS